MTATRSLLVAAVLVSTGLVSTACPRPERPTQLPVELEPATENADQHQFQLDLPTEAAVIDLEWSNCLDEAGVVRCRGSEASLLGAVELQAGNDDMCARTRAGEIACWGASLAPPFVSFERPLWLDLPAPAVEFGLGVDYGCARLDDARVFCWGEEIAIP